MLLGQSLGLSPDLLASVINTSVSRKLITSYSNVIDNESLYFSDLSDGSLLGIRSQQPGAGCFARCQAAGGSQLRGRVSAVAVPISTSN